jgi:hypothetical protein
VWHAATPRWARFSPSRCKEPDVLPLVNVAMSLLLGKQLG